MLRLLVACLGLAFPALALDSVRIVQTSRPFVPMSPVPVMSHGYLFFFKHDSPLLDVYAPDGRLAFTVGIQTPDGGNPWSLNDGATDGQGHFAVSIVYESSNDFQGAIVLLDRQGNVTGSILTQNYIPSHLCFDPEGRIWTRGWQRDPLTRDDDKKDYLVVRRFTVDGKQTGAFVRRSSFPAGIPPGASWFGQWGIRATEDRIGARVYSGRTSERLVWLELDFSGHELGRWVLPPDHMNGMAFGSDELYGARLKRDADSLIWELDLFDRDTSTWEPVASVRNTKQNPCAQCGILMDAKGDELILARDAGLVLEWIRP